MMLTVSNIRVTYDGVLAVSDVSLTVSAGQIVALVGNDEAQAGGLDRATQSRRQPGSTFKPIVYSYALHSRRFTPASLVDVTPSVFTGGYKPTNYEGWTQTDPLRLREALANFDCRVTDSIAFGSHTIFIGEVMSIRMRDGEVDPLIYLNGQYRQLATPAA